jgi:hypothetical protein
MDWQTCTILWLAIYLEQWLHKYPTAVYLFSSNQDATKAPANVKRNYKNTVAQLVWNNDDFKALEDLTGEEARKGLGTVSTRKYASTKAACCGASDGQIEYRGRWVGDKGTRVVRRHYITTDDPYTDASVASMLCDGGPIKYKLKAQFNNVTDNWLFMECIPSIRARFEEDIWLCRLLGLATLWATFDANASLYLDPVSADRIRTNFQSVHGNVPNNGNPVRKVALQIINANDRLDIVEVQEAGHGDNGNPPAGPPAVANAIGGHTDGQVLAYIRRMEQGFNDHLESIRSEQANFRQWTLEQFSKVIRAQQNYRGTVASALVRQDRTEQARRN